MNEASAWKAVLDAHEAVTKANEDLRRALSRLDVILDQKPIAQETRE